MTEQAGYDWTGLWQAWARLGAGAWAATLRTREPGPVEAAVAGFQAFADTVAATLGGVAPAEQAARLAASCEALAASWDGQDSSRWFAAPFACAAVAGEDGAWGGWVAACDTADAWQRELLALPALGPQREWQLAGRRLLEAALAERAARRHLSSHHVEATRAALRAFAAFLRAEDGPPLTSLRALYDAWIGTADEAWRATLMSEAYGCDFGAWVNCVSALRAAWTALDERLAGLSGQPTRAAFEALLTRQQALAAELADLRAARASVPQPANVAVEQDAGAINEPAGTTDEPTPAPVGTARGQPAAPPAARVEPPAPRATGRARPGPATKRAPARQARKPAAARTPPRGASKPAARGARTPAAEFDIASILDGSD